MIFIMNARVKSFNVTGRMLKLTARLMAGLLRRDAGPRRWPGHRAAAESEGQVQVARAP